jgi:LacI family transcriptional regulator
VPTIADVAARAGVGLGTVSRVLNGSPKVADATRTRVEAAIAELDYRPSPLARGLSRGRCQTLGVLVPFFTHASAVERLRGVVAGLHGSHYDLVLFNVESPLHRDEHLAALQRRDRADGLLILSLPVPGPDLERLRRSGVPVVLVDTAGEGVPSVVTDDVEGGRMAAQHLIDLGHRTIAFVGPDEDEPLGFTSAKQREVGFEQALRAARVTVRRSLRRHVPHERGAARGAARALLDRADRPSGVFASSDVQALGVLDAAADLGRRVPEDVSVIGFDDVEVAEPLGLTTIRQPLHESGRLGTELLLAALDGDLPAPVAHHLDLELVVRRTTAPAARSAA